MIITAMSRLSNRLPSELTFNPRHCANSLREVRRRSGARSCTLMFFGRSSQVVHLSPYEMVFIKSSIIPGRIALPV